MYYLLLLLLFLITLGIAAYILNGRDILSPWLISITVISLSVIVCLVNVGKWNIEIYPLTILLLFLALLLFGVGDVVSKTLGRSFFKSNNHRLFDEKPIKVSSGITMLFVIFMGGTLFLYFRYIYSISLLAGNSGGYDEMFKFARYAVINTKYQTEVPSYLSHFLMMSKTIAYVYIFSLIYNKLFFNRINISYFFPIIMYGIQISISTARIDFIRLIVYILMLFFILWKKSNNWDRMVDVKIILLGVVGIIVFLILFRFLGFLTGKTDVRNLWDDISIYIGSSIVGLNQYLREPGQSEFFGKETLYNIYTILRKLRLTSIAEYNTPLEFIYFSDFRTNIYTSLRRYIQDYGQFGMLFIFFIQGMFYSGWMEKIKRTTTSAINIIIFCSIFYPVVEVAIDEQFISNIFTLATLYQSIYLYIFFHLITRRKIYFN